jgi:hypothetical protein
VFVALAQGIRKMLDLQLRVYATRRCRACWRGLLSRRPGSFFKEMNHQGETDPRMRFSGGGTVRTVIASSRTRLRLPSGLRC